PQYEQFLAVVKRFEEQLGMPWREAARSLTNGGTYIAFDLPTQGVISLSQAADEQLAAKAQTTSLELIRQIATAQGQPDPIKEEEHRGVKIYKVGEAYSVVLGRWLISSNKQVLISMLLENHFTDGETLAEDQQFRDVLKSRTGQPSAWLYVDLRVLRLTGALKQALNNKKSDNPPAEILAGGILGAIPDAAYVTASLDIVSSGIKLTASLPAKTQEIAKAREFYFGPEAAGRAPPLLKPAGTLLTISTYRDFASLWRNAPDLFDEGINAKFAEAESNLTTLFAGRNFRDDILGNVEPGMQIVVAKQEFPQAGITPQIKLPAGALVVRMKNPAETSRMFKITFQSLIGFLNVVGGMNGLDPLEQNTEKIGDATVISSVYLPPIKEETKTEAPLHFNASPTVAFVGDRFILASARPLAVALVDLVSKDEPSAGNVNTELALDGKTALAALADNRGPLIAQNMLQKGHDRAAAEKEIDTVLKAAKQIQSSSLRLTTEPDHLQLSLEVVLSDTK
ncbi:MAG TPA: hypothetical protein VFV87_16735, partial [Pirellulaceae bacterium]|nr:hypothetical protein [Pirellulaceae bacterium]